MNQENLVKKYNHANEMLEIKNYAEFKHKVLSNIPNLKLMAKSFMQTHIKELTGENIDPDHVRLYSGFKMASPLDKSYSGWQYWAPEKSLTLTDLAFKNFNAHDQDLTTDDLKLNYGVYKNGPKEKVMYTDPSHYGVAEKRMIEHFTEKDQVKILPSDLRKTLNKNDFYAHVKSSINTFWQNHEADMLILTKATFVSEARLARLEKVISEDDYKVAGRRYYRAEDYSDRLEPIPLPLSERLNKIRTEGLGGSGSKVAGKNMAEENPEPTRSSKSSQSISGSESSFEIEDDATNEDGISLSGLFSRQLGIHNPVQLNIFKICFNNALKMCIEADRIVRSLNDTQLREELEKAFGRNKFLS